MCFPAWKKKDGAYQTVLIAMAQRDQSRGFPKQSRFGDFSSAGTVI